jgi:uncharacterized membrane protein
MAGIGFQLHKLIEDESFLSKAKAFIFASIITSGPWILSILCLAFLGFLSGHFLADNQFAVVNITIVYTFAFSLIITGPIQFVLTRYLADKEYLKEKERMLSALFSALLLSIFVSLLFTVPWYYHIEGSIAYKVISILLFCIISSIWTMMDFLSCLKHYQSIVLAFFGGSILSIILLPFLGQYYGLEGALAGYTLGQAGILAFLLISIKREFSFHGFFNKEYFTYFKGFPYILFTGLFYNLALWSDKLIGWFFYGDPIYGNFRAFTIYDTPVFIAYLSIIPSLAYFMIVSETRFYLVHRRFFDSIAKETLYNIQTYKTELISLLKKSMVQLCLIQLFTSLAGFIFADFIGAFFNLPPGAVNVLRILFFAAGAQVLFLYIIIFMMYFDLSRFSFFIVFIFFLLNSSTNLMNFYVPVIPIGWPYLLSITLSFVIGCMLLFSLVKDIEIKIFQNQTD